MAKVFVSYSRKDIEFAKRLTAELQKSDLDFWIDWEGIPPTVDWWREIEKGIEEADVFLFLISPDSAKSKICEKEIDTSVKNGKRIIPIVVREIEWQDTPPQLGHLNYIFFSRDDDFGTAVKKLMTAIQTDYEWAATHRRLQVKALEWERENKENSYLLRGRDLQDAELDLATNTSKDPHPTDLQREYVFESRKATDRQRRITTGVSIAAAIALAALAVFGFYQARQANIQSENSRAGELAAQSVGIREKDFQISLLLSIEAFRWKETPRSRGALLDLTNTNPQLLQFITDYSNAGNLAFSPDGKTLAFGNPDNSIILWDMNQGKQIGEPLSGHKYPVTTVAFSTDSKTLASSSADNIIILWDIKTGNQITQLRNGHQSTIMTIAFSPDGKTLASGGQDSTIILWDINARTPINPPLMGHYATVSSLAFSPNGKLLASSSWTTEVRLWDVIEHELITELNGHQGKVNSLAFSPDGKTLASGSDDNSIILWDVATRKQTAQIPTGSVNFVRSVAFNPNGNILASDICGEFDSNFSCRGEIILWDLATHQQIGRPLQGHTKSISSLAFHPDGNILASGSGDNTIILWDLERQHILGRSLTRHENWVTSVAFSPDSQTLASGGTDNSIRLWDVATGGQIEPSFEGYISYSVAFSPNGKLLAAVSGDDAVVLWDVTTGDQFDQPLVGHPDYVHNPSASPNGKALVFSPDGKILAAGSTDDDIILWDLSSRSQIGSPLKANAGRVHSLAFSPNGRILASGGSNGDIFLWDLEKGTQIRQHLKSHSSAVLSLDFSPDGKILISGSADTTVMVWEVSTGQPLDQPLTEHSGLVWGVAFSPDGEIFASGSDDKSIILWDVTTHQPIGQPITIGDRIMHITFSPDGKFLAAAIVDGTVMLWDMDPESWQTISCQRAGRNLNRAEWKRYFPDKDYPTLSENATCRDWPIEPELTLTPTLQAFQH